MFRLTGLTAGRNLAGMGILLLIVAGALFVTVYLPYQRKQAIKREAEAWLEQVEAAGRLAVVPVSAMLKRGEEGHYEIQAKLFEPRATRHYVGSSKSVRIMKGISIRTSSGRSVSTQHWQQIDAGNLVVTNRRLLFDGSGEHRSIDIGKIDGIDAFGDGIRVTVSTRKKPFAFVVPQPLILATMLAALQDPEKYLPAR